MEGFIYVIVAFIAAVAVILFAVIITVRSLIKCIVRKFKCRQRAASNTFRNGERNTENIALNEHSYPNRDLNTLTAQTAIVTEPNSNVTCRTQCLYEISKDDIQINMEHILGTGQFGVVYKARLLSNGENVAVKMLHDGSSDTALKGMQSELKLLCGLGKHPNSVTFIGCHTRKMEQGNLWIVMELCEGGSLISYLREKRAAGLTDDFGLQNLLKFAYEIACGMEYVEKRGIIHGDLAARNVLLDCYGICKIGDFGLSRQLYDYSKYMKTSHEPLPWRWMAYESLSVMEFSHKSDIWMYGITLWEIFSLGNIPYPGLAWNINFVEQLERGLRPSSPRFASPEIYSIMTECWDLNPLGRPNYEYILQRFNSFAVTLAVQALSTAFNNLDYLKKVTFVQAH